MDIEAAMGELKSVLWILLDYQTPARRRNATTG
jgi:hypothetical protein